MDSKTMAARIKALLAKTTENGCSEAEAMAAATKARELMDKYQIDLGAVGMEAEGVEKRATENSTYKTFGIRWRLAYSIMSFCDVKCWSSKQKQIIFFGLQSDADFATWLIESLDAFIQRSAVEYMMWVKPEDLPTGTKMPRWEAEKAFILGAIHRITERLKALTAERHREMAAGTGKSLVVVKSAIVNKAFSALGMKLRSSSSKTTFHGGSAYQAGQAAGDRASFGRPVNGGGGTRLLK